MYTLMGGYLSAKPASNATDIADFFRLSNRDRQATLGADLAGAVSSRFPMRFHYIPDAAGQSLHTEGLL